MVRVSDIIKLLQDDRINWEEEIARNISVDDCRAMPAAGADRMQDDIKAYLTTFEQIMTIHKIDWSRWSYKLSPELTEKAQFAYAAMDTAVFREYEQVKAVIIQRTLLQV